MQLVATRCSRYSSRIILNFLLRYGVLPPGNVEHHGLMLHNPDKPGVYLALNKDYLTQYKHHIEDMYFSYRDKLYLDNNQLYVSKLSFHTSVLDNSFI